jgi:nitroreductase
MTFSEIVARNRSYRRFDGSHRIAEKMLRELVALARITPSGGNKQPLKYVLSSSAKMNEEIFENLAWAAYLPDWGGPEAAERPTAYIVVLSDADLQINADVDVGIASQTILLGAAEMGLGGCMLASVKREALSKLLSLPEKLKIALVIALGKPKEKVVIEDAAAGGSIKYYRDGERTHHVPKRTLQELIYASYA